MSLETLLTCLFIIAGRMADVTLGTVRTISVVRGRKHTAVLLGFTEVLIWIFVVAKVVSGLSENLILGVCYAGGFALGNFLGITVDEWLAFGEQSTMIVSKQGRELAKALREKGWVITELPGQGRDGPTVILMAITARRKVAELHKQVEELDPNCFYTVEDIRHASNVAARSQRAQGWGALFAGK